VTQGLPANPRPGSQAGRGLGARALACNPGLEGRATLRPHATALRLVLGCDDGLPLRPDNPGSSLEIAYEASPPGLVPCPVGGVLPVLADRPARDPPMVPKEQPWIHPDARGLEAGTDVGSERPGRGEFAARAGAG
jgi:hypothetical protein